MHAYMYVIRRPYAIKTVKPWGCPTDQATQNRSAAHRAPRTSALRWVPPAHTTVLIIYQYLYN